MRDNELARYPLGRQSDWHAIHSWSGWDHTDPDPGGASHGARSTTGAVHGLRPIFLRATCRELVADEGSTSKIEAQGTSRAHCSRPRPSDPRIISMPDLRSRIASSIIVSGSSGWPSVKRTR